MEQIKRLYISELEFLLNVLRTREVSNFSVKASRIILSIDAPNYQHVLIQIPFENNNPKEIQTQILENVTKSLENHTNDINLTRTLQTNEIAKFSGITKQPEIYILERDDTKFFNTLLNTCLRLSYGLK